MSSRAVNTRRAVTLTELLVSITIVAGLAGLVLGGVQATRNAVAHVEHLNWLRQRRLDDPPSRKTLKIAFIGNSHTYVNDIPGVVVEFAKTIGVTIIPTRVLLPGQSLEGHWEGSDAQNAITSDWHDFVVLQEQSTMPIFAPASYSTYASLFCDLARDDSVPLLYLVWAREAMPETQKTLTNAAQWVMDNHADTEVCVVGEAWATVRTQKPDLELFRDGNHASEIGGYLTACVFHSTIHRRSPVGLPNNVVTENGTAVFVDADLAVYLQTVAWKTAEKYREKFKPPLLRAG